MMGLVLPAEMLLISPIIEFKVQFCDPDSEWVDSEDICQPLLLQCPAGEYMYGDGKEGSSCIPCPRNMYKDQANADKECVMCPEKASNPLVGGVNVSACRWAGTFGQQ